MPVTMQGSTSGSCRQIPSVFQVATSPTASPSSPLIAAMVAYLRAGEANPHVNPLMNDNVRNIMSAFRLSAHSEDVYATCPRSDGSRYEMEFRGEEVFFRIYTRDDRLYSQTPLPEKAEITRFMERFIVNAETLAEWEDWARRPAPGEKRTEALRRVTDNIYSNAKFLDLSNLNLSTIPPHIPCRVTDLLLNENSLTTLPVLHHGLVRVCAGGNRLSVLPAEYPSTLAELRVAGNYLRSLPAFPDTLKTICLGKNRLTSFNGLPLTATRLSLQNNPVSPATLPDFTAFTALEMADLQGLGLKACPPLPPGILDLDLSDNPIDTPPEVANFKQLRILLMDNCHLKALPELPQSLHTLSASNNEISSLPPLPRTLKQLVMMYNRLSATGVLPGTLEYVNFIGNQLVMFDAGLPQLQKLLLSRNKLTRIVGPFSNTLEVLSVGKNHLSALPPLPDSLKILHIHRNRFISPPPRPPALSEYSDGKNLYDYRPPVESIVKWFDSSQQADEIQRWSDIAAETCPVDIRQNMTAAKRVALIRQNETRQGEKARLFLFARFLDRLQDLLKKNPAECEYVTKWLRRIAVDPELRRSAFYLAEEASATCGDRVLLYWSQMKLAVMVADAENMGRQTETLLAPTRPQSEILADMIRAGRDIFFTEKINEVSGRLIMKARAARSAPMEDGNLRSGPEEVEIMLAVHCKLAPLLLGTTQPAVNMLFFGSSGLSEDKLIQLYDEIKASEQTEFIPWFAQWHVWQNYARTHYGEMIREGENRLDLAMYPEERDEDGNLTGSGEFEKLTSEILTGMGFGKGVPPPEDVSTQAGRKAGAQLKSQIWGDVFSKIAEKNRNLSEVFSTTESTGYTHRLNLTARRRSPGPEISGSKRVCPPSTPPPSPPLVAVASLSKEPVVRDVGTSTGLSPVTGYGYHPLI